MPSNSPLGRMTSDVAQIKQPVLAAIARNDGKWSWYQLDRALSAQGLDVSRLMDALSELEAEGLVRALPVAERPGQPLYALTSEGKRRAA